MSYTKIDRPNIGKAQTPIPRDNGSNAHTNGFYDTFFWSPKSGLKVHELVNGLRMYSWIQRSGSSPDANDKKPWAQRVRLNSFIVCEYEASMYGLWRRGSNTPFYILITTRFCEGWILEVPFALKKYHGSLLNR